MTTALIIILNAAFAVGISVLLAFVMTRALKLPVHRPLLAEVRRPSHARPGRPAERAGERRAA